MQGDHQSNIVEKITALGYEPKEVSDLVDSYFSIKPTLPVEDKPMKRLCQTLTEHGYITQESCDGHGKDLPIIDFYCEDQKKLRHLAYILGYEIEACNFSWCVRIDSDNPVDDPDSPLTYILEPYPVSIDVKEHYDELLEDLDMIGIFVMNHFNEL